MPAEDPSLFDSFEQKGQWWLPESPDRRLSGSLSRREDGNFLDLIGSFPEEAEYTKSDHITPFQVDIIIGMLENGVVCTLYNNLHVETKSAVSGTNHFTGTGYEAEFLFLGKQFQTTKDLKFKSLFVNYSNLEQWITQRSQIDSRFTHQRRKVKGVIAKCHPNEHFDAKIEKLNTRMHFHYQISHGSGGRNSFNTSIISYTAYLVIVPREPKDIQWFHKIITNIQTLLSLFIEKPIHSKHVVAETIGFNSPRIYFRQGYAHSGRPAFAFEMIMPLANIGSDIERVFCTWFDKLEILETAVNLFFGVLYSPSMSSDFRFPSYMQAIETYHRKSIGGTYISCEDYETYYQQMVSHLPNDLSSDHRQSLKSRLKYGNEYSLRKRLKEILEQFDHRLLNIAKIDPKSFIKEVVDTRNYLTHFEKDADALVLKGLKLHIAIRRLKLVLYAIFLRELGFSWDQIVQTL